MNSSPKRLGRVGVPAKPPLIDAEGRPFGERPALLVPVVWIVAGCLAAESVGVAGLAIAGRWPRGTSVRPSEAAVAAADDDTAEGASEAPARAAAPAVVPKEAATRPTAPAVDDAEGLTAMDATDSPTETGDEADDQKVASTDQPKEATKGQEPDAPAKTATTEAAGDAPMTSSAASTAGSGPSVFADLERRHRVLSLPAQGTEAAHLVDLPVESPASLELEIGSGASSGRGKLSLKPTGAGAAGTGDVRVWDLRQGAGTNGFAEELIGRFRWEAGKLSFAWQGVPHPQVKYASLAVRAESQGAVHTAACQFVPSLVAEPVAPKFSGTGLTVGLGLKEGVPVAKEHWRMSVRLDGVPQATATGPTDLEVGKTVTWKFPDPDDSSVDLVEIDATLQEQQSKPVLQLTYWVSRPDPDPEKEAPVRVPISRKEIPQIAKRDQQLVSRLEKELDKVGVEIARLSPPTPAYSPFSPPQPQAPPLSASNQRKLERLKAREEKLGEALDRLGEGDEWGTTVAAGLDAIEKSARIELRFSLVYPAGEGVELVRTKGFESP